MMTPEDVSVPLRSVMGSVVLHVRVTGARTFGARVWLGRQLIALGARVIGCAVTVEIVRGDG